VFDLRAVISTEVLFTTTRGCMRLRSGRYSPLKLPMQEHNAKAAFSSSYAPPAPLSPWMRLRKSIRCPMSDVSPTPRLGVAEAMGEERCY